MENVQKSNYYITHDDCYSRRCNNLLRVDVAEIRECLLNSNSFPSRGILDTMDLTQITKINFIIVAPSSSLDSHR